MAAKKNIHIEEVDNGVVVRTTTETKTRKGDWKFTEKKKVLVGNEAKKLMSLVTGKIKKPITKRKKR